LAGSKAAAPPIVRLPVPTISAKVVYPDAVMVTLPKAVKHSYCPLMKLPQVIVMPFGAVMVAIPCALERPNGESDTSPSVPPPPDALIDVPLMMSCPLGI